MNSVAAWNCLQASMTDSHAFRVLPYLTESVEALSHRMELCTRLVYCFICKHNTSLTYRSQGERIRFKRFAVSCLTAERRPLHVSNHFNVQNGTAAVCRHHDDVIFMYLYACGVVFIVVRAHSHNVLSECMCLRRIDRRAWPSHTPRPHQICSKQTSSILSVRDCGCVSYECAPIDG